MIFDWTRVTERPLTEEEKEIYGNDFEVILDGELPCHGQSVLVAGVWGVDLTVFYNEDYPYFDSYGEGEVFAWSELPEPYFVEK